MHDPTKIEVWILVDELGNYVAETESCNLQDRYDADIGETDVALRRIKISLEIPSLPAPIELRGTVPAEASEGSLVVA